MLGWMLAISGNRLAYAQDATNKATPTAAQWQSATGDKAYQYKDFLEYKEIKESTPPEPPNWLLQLMGGIYNFLRSDAGRILLWVLLISVVGYVIYRIVWGDSGFFSKTSRKLALEEAQVEIPEDIHGSDYAALVGKAMSSGEHRLAIRFTYLWLLQLLEQSGHIRYSHDKTNAAYRSELYDTPHYEAFVQLARQYEYAWYGNFVPDTKGTLAYIELFNQAKNRLS